MMNSLGHSDLSKPVISLPVTVIQMGEMSQLRRLIGLVKDALCANFLYCCHFQFPKS
jgi:hypothetical protein